MFILSQNGKHLLETTGMCLGIGYTSETETEIIAFSLASQNEQGHIILGFYETTERALQVLRSIPTRKINNMFYMPNDKIILAEQ